MSEKQASAHLGHLAQPAIGMLPISDTHEWLEADGLGGFASSTTSGIRTRRYHALLLTATIPPSGRMALVNGVDAWIDVEGKRFWLSSQRYAPDVVTPNQSLESFHFQPWPLWRFRFSDEVWLDQEIFVPRGQSTVVLSWRLCGRINQIFSLSVKPFLSGRDFHATHHENRAFCFEPLVNVDTVRWQPYPGVPAVVCRSRGLYQHAPTWYRNFLYSEEQERGLDFIEDLAAPGTLSWQLDTRNREAVLTFSAEGFAETGSSDLEEWIAKLRFIERERRGQTPDPVEQASESYFVRRGAGRTIIAGYPWFGDWGRDTFISIRGLGIAMNRLEWVRDILLEWANAVSQGMLPNLFPDRGTAPEYNSVDASPWYIIVVGDLFDTASAYPGLIDELAEHRLRNAIEAILLGYQTGTRFNIRVDNDGLLAAGASGVQLTWMDAKVDGKVVTPRIGKPVEVQALWINALAIAKRFSPKWEHLFEKALLTFENRFWNEAKHQLFDVVDVDHQPGSVDPLTRPNQIFAVGGLPLSLLSDTRARQVVDSVEAELWTPTGLRSLGPNEPGFTPRYTGTVLARDSAYHQGTVWPWLAGAFIEAWVRVRRNTPEAKAAARQRYFEPLRSLVGGSGLNHLPEITDAVEPHTPRGCPFQAWSVGEFLRLDRVILRN
jgi:predicted glycogen debranching enzyme